ncbi:MAG: alpha/beta fold hydrolase [Alphaproteobacteria bacterium]|nr:alpha/beta fold hydrolase [Alphaproteobacteria bacterium]
MISAYTEDGTAYEVTGNPEGMPLILIHGLGLSRATWDGYIEALAPRHHLIRYDLFGHGDSAMPPRAPDLTLFSEQIISLMDHLGLREAVMVGFSLGGMINRRIALDHPERVKGLVILNSPHERGEAEQAKVEERARMTAEDGIASTIEATLERWFTPGFIASQPADVDKVRQGVLANPLEAYAACRYVLAAGVVELIRPEVPITLPTLVMTCQNDSGSTPAMSEDIAKEIPGASCIIIPDLQHMGLVERPELFLPEMTGFFSQLANG